jgi:hypothetical protein
MSSPLPDECPPPAAAPPTGEFLRLVDKALAVGDTPGPEEWQRPYLNPRSSGFGHPEVCDNHAHSLFADKTDIAQARSVVPAFRKKRVARVALTPDMGLVLNTPNLLGRSHHDWWPSPHDLIPASTVIE